MNYLFQFAPYFLNAFYSYGLNQHNDNIVLVNYRENNNILLTKKRTYNIFEENFYKEHNLEKIATFGNDEIYLTSKNNFEKYENTFTTFMTPHSDFDIKINLPFLNKTQNKWHLNRIVNRESKNKRYNKTTCVDNTKVTVYVIDTGIDIDHPDFNNRVSWGKNFADDIDNDCNGHGTHVAGLIGSKTFGVCKNTQMIAVKVLDCNGSGEMNGVIRALDWVQKEHIKKKPKKTVINMSLGGGKSQVLDVVIKNMIKSGIFVVVAAGNENNDACFTSPAGVLNALTVMASDINDNRAYFSNFGPCADIYSPGVDIFSTFPDNKYRSLSGTSMASPIMVGVLLHYIKDLNSTTFKNFIYLKSTKNIIKNNPPNTNNSLVYLE